ncbi:hypothetical protein RSOL_380480 [Rhizoctonia solani AG-3 Rhs1AP]|uniref:Uncharacterized protein n=2 Tax=Rhizoctonia solani AG-3 TaxID=1086053 RepID=A0A074S130_9AGAM|nr:hypothetical protein RSOL_380480 [Rhizoctonia solani AG-3 Rhs1AP]KEP52959.1 hypothetical protein V565_037480 [Rhizoctonia solani 123E]
MNTMSLLSELVQLVKMPPIMPLEVVSRLHLSRMSLWAASVLTGLVCHPRLYCVLELLYVLLSLWKGPSKLFNHQQSLTYRRYSPGATQRPVTGTILAKRNGSSRQVSISSAAQRRSRTYVK